MGHKSVEIDIKHSAKFYMPILFATFSTKLFSSYRFLLTGCIIVNYQAMHYNRYRHFTNNIMANIICNNDNINIQLVFSSLNNHLIINQIFERSSDIHKNYVKK